LYLPIIFFLFVGHHTILYTRIVYIFYFIGYGYIYLYLLLSFFNYSNFLPVEISTTVRYTIYYINAFRHRRELFCCSRIPHKRLHIIIIGRRPAVMCDLLWVRQSRRTGNRVGNSRFRTNGPPTRTSISRTSTTLR